MKFYSVPKEREVLFNALRLCFANSLIQQEPVMNLRIPQITSAQYSKTRIGGPVL